MQLTSSSPETGAAKTGAVIGFLAVFACYKLAVMGFGHPLAWVAGYALDVAIVGVVYLAAMALQRAPLPGARVASAVVFWSLFAIWFGAEFAYTYFFPQGADRHLSLLEIGPSQLRYFVVQLFPRTGWFLLVALVLVCAIIAVWSAPRLRLASLRGVAAAVALVTLVAGTLAWRVPDVPNPAIDIAHDLRDRFTEVTYTVDDDTAPAGPITLWDRSATAPLTHESRFKRILVIVMETMPLDTYRAERDSLPPDNFFRTLDAHAHSFTRYFTANQDSRTAMLDMLLSRMIPYEAYDEAGENAYKDANEWSSLPEFLHENGFETTYALSQVDSEMVVADLPWQKVMTLTKPQIDTLKPRWLCFFPFEFENSCEDKVLLGDVVRFMEEHDKAFVYQEMMWGHALEYNKASGKGNVRYVAEYVDSLWRELGKRKLTEGTLLVLTGDHGDKAEDRATNPIAYRVPLYFYAQGFEPSVDDRMRSHLDFKELLLHELDPTRPLPPPIPFVHVVGPTDSRLHIIQDASGGYAFYKLRGDRAYLIKASTPKSPDIRAHMAMFNKYREWFDANVPKEPAR